MRDMYEVGLITGVGVRFGNRQMLFGDGFFRSLQSFVETAKVWLFVFLRDVSESSSV